MARKVQVILEDDLVGGEADRTVEFSFDGTRYEIDLNTTNIDALAEALQPYIAKARTVGGKRVATSGRRRRTAAAPSASQRNAEVRAWAQAQGMRVSERGRISATVLEAYDNAH